MYSIKIEASFSAAHNLKGYKGKCEELHGHNWKVEVTAESEVLDKIGMVLDFKYLKMKLNKILEVLDHKYLNEIPYFSAAGARGSSGQGSASGGKKVNPTSENIAKYIYIRIKSHVPLVKSVTVWESENSLATYYD
ncbi:MAG: 6-carboxytetrahydropterin synthase QueD [Candidatus Omnitrophota bacterium]